MNKRKNMNNVSTEVHFAVCNLLNRDYHFNLVHLAFCSTTEGDDEYIGIARDSHAQDEFGYMGFLYSPDDGIYCDVDKLDYATALINMGNQMKIREVNYS